MGGVRKRVNALDSQVKLKRINLIARLTSAVCKQTWNTGKSAHVPATQSKSAMIDSKVVGYSLWAVNGKFMLLNKHSI